MADDGKDHGDDNTNDEGFDPWADLETEGSTDLGEGFSFSVDDVSLDAGLDSPADALADTPADTPSGESVTTEDAFVDAWLNEPTDEASQATPLSVFVPDDLTDVGETDVGETVGGDAAGSDWPGDPAAIEIGTGQSGFTSASDIDALGLGADDAVLAEATGEEAVFGTASVDDTEPEAVEAIGFADVEGDGEQAGQDIIDFGTAAGAVSLAAAAADGETVAVTAKPGSADKGKRKKRGPLGQLLGVLLGGFLAIPIVLGILIGLMWMGWNDTVGIRRLLPEQLSFLLPQARNPVAMGMTGGPDPGAAPTLNELAASDDAMAVAEEASTPSPDAEPAAEASVSPVVTEEPVATETAPSSDSLPALAADPAITDEPAELVADGGAVNNDPPPAAAPPAAVFAEPSLNDVAAIAPPPTDGVAPAKDVAPPPPAVPVVSEREPLDLGGLEATVAEATAALDAVEAVADPTDPVRKTLLVDWYKQLARVAQELAMLEHRAADSGRPLAATPAVAAELGGRILAAPDLADDLARLARNWLTYSRRDGDGVVMPATFSGSRRVGPYWCSRVSIAEAGGASRELSVISRIEPTALPGDAVIVMGLVMDGGVLWASELLSASAASAPAAAAKSDPFSQPGL
jgi:hypothetical protein